MMDWEAIQIIGAKRYSNYKGYASTTEWSGAYEEKVDVDDLG